MPSYFGSLSRSSMPGTFRTQRGYPKIKPWVQTPMVRYVSSKHRYITCGLFLWAEKDLSTD